MVAAWLVVVVVVAVHRGPPVLCPVAWAEMLAIGVPLLVETDKAVTGQAAAAALPVSEALRAHP